MNPAAYVLVRQDMPLVHQFIQAMHATHEAGALWGTTADASCRLVLCAVAGVQELDEEVIRARERDVKIYVVTDLTALALGHTAACTEPLEPQRRRLFRHLKIYREVPTAGFEPARVRLQNGCSAD